ncbi:hypothetical protein EMCRGX_G021692 [Ephydatia muelleri]
MEGQPSLCNFLLLPVFYYMEQHDLLDPINENHLFALHYVYLPRINRSLKQFKEAWNCHGLRTERGKTPNQLFTAGLLRLRYSGLDAVDLFEDVSDEYGQSEEGGSNNEEAVDDDQGVPVPQLSVSITPVQLSRIQETVSPLSDDSDYGISLGCLYLCEIDDSEAVPEHPTKKFKPSVDSGAHCSKDLASSDWNETVQQSSDNTGKASPREVIDLGSGSESDNESELGRAQAYIEEARQIRKEQDEAYQQSLEADKAKAKAEREQLQDIRKDLSRQWSNKLTQPEGMKFTLRFSDSSKTECRLLPLTSSKVLYEIATAYGNVTKGFSIHTIIPRELVPVTCQVKDISSSVLIVEEGENAPDLLTFVRETLGQAEEEQVVEEVKDGSQLIQRVNEMRHKFMSDNTHQGVGRAFHRDHVYEDVIKTYEDNLEEILKDYPFRVRFINEKAVDMGGVCRDLFSAFWEDSYVKIFDGEKLLVPAVRPNPDMAVLRLHGTILSHGFMVCGFLPIRIAFPVLAAIFFGPEVEVPDSIILDSFIDYLAAYESSFISQALTKVQNNNQLPSTLQGQIISTLSRMGCVQVPTKANLKETMTVSEFFGLYKALNATSERVLDLIEEPSAMNSAEKRIFSYLITFAYYLDDGALAGNCPAVLGAMHSIEEMGPALDLYSNFSKCELFSSKGNTSFPPAVKYSLLPNLDILGAPIGDY